MSTLEDKLNEFEGKLNELALDQSYFESKIDILKLELEKLRAEYANENTANPQVEPLIAQQKVEEKVKLEEKPVVVETFAEKIVIAEKIAAQASIVDMSSPAKVEPVKPIPTPTPKPSKPIKPKKDINWERLIGENLINKIGILILIIGVGFGMKYSIDHNLISPETRIILAYIMSIGLIGFAIKLKKKYLSLSAVLLSGAIAIMYFVTFMGYSMYGMFSKELTFGLMFLFTIFTIVAALHYNNQIIAHIGLVGAYAVPFFLSDGSGKVLILFIYMAIINIGILAIGIKKNWKPLFYVAFGITWLIFMAWFGKSYEHKIHFGIALTFLTIYAGIFQTLFFIYKEEADKKLINVFFLCLNTFLLNIYTATLIALCGAEFVPTIIMIAYSLIVNSVILYIALKKDIKALFYFTFGLSWIVFISWYTSNYDAKIYFTTALVYITITFGIFQALFFLKKQDLSGLILNPFLLTLNGFMLNIFATSIFFNSGTINNVSVIMFSYITLMNIGLVILGFRNYWRPLFYTAFLFTWGIFAAWYSSNNYKIEEHFGLALSIIIIYFAFYYVIMIVHRLREKSEFNYEDIISILVNSFLFFGLAYAILDSNPLTENLLGLFTVFNAIIHFAFAYWLYKGKSADKNMFYFAAGLVLVFLTIAIPVQLDGNWVTLLWTFEGALMFWIGRSKSVKIYEILSYPLMFLATTSLLQDWGNYYGSTEMMNPFINTVFMSGVCYVIAMSIITLINRKNEKLTPKIWDVEVYKPLSLIFPIVLFLFTYLIIRLEINSIFTLQEQPLDKIIYNLEYDSPLYNRISAELTSISRFAYLWQITFTFAFMSALSFANIRWIKSEFTEKACLGLNLLFMILFITKGLNYIGDLRNEYLHQSADLYYVPTSMNIIIRYISLLFFGITLFMQFQLQKKFKQLNIAFEYLLHSFILIISATEIISWMDMAGAYQESFKLALSILCGSYSLLLIVLGIKNKKKYLRITAIALFTATLLKLFFYDIAHLTTIYKTIVFISLGVLLLIISFVYNKYKHLIEDEIKA